MAGLRMTVQKSSAMSLTGRIAAAVAAYALFIGIAGGMVAACGTELPASAIAAACAVAACVIAAGCALACIGEGATHRDPRHGRAERLFYIVAAVAIAVLCLVMRESFIGGGAYLANDLIMRIGERTQEYALPYAVGAEGDLAFFCCMAATAIALACSLMAQHGGAVPAVVIGAVVLVGVIAGWVPVGWWTALLALGVCLLVGGRAVFACDAAARSSLAWAFACMLAVCAVVAGGTALALRSQTADVQGAQSAIERLLWGMRYGDAEFAMPEGDLRDVGDLRASDQAALTVTTDQPTLEYLRGFVGERYDQSRWLPLESDAVMDARDTLYWLDQDGFAAAAQISQAADLVGYDDGNPATLSITPDQVRGPYAYLPYGYTDGANAHLTTNLAQTRADGAAGASAGQLAYDAGITRQAYLVQEALEKAQAKASSGASAGANAANAAAQQALRTYLDDESAYRVFAEDAYLDIPDDVRAVFEKLYGKPVKLTTEQAKIQVLYHLDDTVAYADGSEDDRESASARSGADSDDVSPDEDVDFVIDFLTRTRSGYSVHYATAATLLLRYYGVPARYVEGYVLNTAQLDEEAGEPAAGGQYTLTERQAHAWTEYYLDGVGWLPYDVTPGWRAPGYYETTADTELIEESQNWSVGQAAKDAVWNPPEQEPQVDDEQEASPSPIFAELDFLIMEWPWALLGFLLTLLAAFIVRDALLHARLRRFLAQATDGTAAPRDAVTSLFSYAVLLVRDCGGVALVNAPYAAQAARVQEAGLCADETFAQAAAANDRALFASGDVGDADVQIVAACLTDVRAGLRSQVPALSRFRQRHIRCLW